jgi:carbamoyltransferase
MNGTSAPRINDMFAVEDPWLKGYFQMLSSEFEPFAERAQPADTLFVSHAEYLLIHHLLRAHSNAAQRDMSALRRPRGVSALRSVALTRVQDYIAANLAGNIALTDLKYIVFYDKPLIKYERLLETYLAFAPRGIQSFLTAMPVWLKEKLLLKDLLKNELVRLHQGLAKSELPPVLFTEHHESHAASAFYPSPFDKAAILCVDGVGEWATTSAWMGDKNQLTPLWEIPFPHSLGLLYSAFTYFTGFKVNSGEYKLMGLAPYGEPRYAGLILDKLIDLKPDGSFRLNLDYFNYCVGLTMTNSKFDALFGEPPRTPEQLLTPFHMDIAASIQQVTEEVMLRMTRALARETGERNLCLAGGVALNCVANGKVLRDGQFENIWIQPAAGDAGGAVGAALCAYHLYRGQPRRPHEGLDGMRGSYLGPQFEQRDVEQRLQAVGAKFSVVDDAAVIAEAVEALTAQKALGWFQGRMEFGPRALGARSILGDPRSPGMQKLLNLKVKYRESFRPFAPAVLREDVSEWFELDYDSPYMLLVAGVQPARRRAMTEEEKKLFGIDQLNVPRSDIPAVTHIDYSARVQTVHRETNPRFHALLSAFKQRTGCPVLVNTSFNVRGEPIVCTPEDAFRCFMGSEIESLVIGNCVLQKEQQNPALKLDYKHAFEPD